jgi:hypothetical protein
VHYLKVMSTIDFEDNDFTAWQIPFGVQITPSAGCVLSLALSGRDSQAEPPAQACQIDLAQGLGALTNVSDRQSEISLMPNATDHLHCFIQARGRG